MGVVFPPIEAANVAISIYRGNYLEAAEYGIAIIPFAGRMLGSGQLGARVANLLCTTSRLGNVAVCGYRAYQAVQTGDWLGLGFSALWFLKALRSACFVAGTQVLTGINADGTFQSRNIEDLKIGDLVLTRDQNDPDGKLELRPITNLYVHTVYDLRVLQLTSPDGNVETLRTTDEHPFYCLGKGWTGAGELLSGDLVLQEDGTYATVTSSVFESHPEGLSVYNFEVEGDHTYFVEDGQGEQSAVWVHNRCDRHHPVAKFLGGKPKQLVASMDSTLHTGAGGFHSELRLALRAAGLPLAVGGRGGGTPDWAAYFHRFPGSQRSAIDTLIRTSRDFDAAHGTSLLATVKRNLVRGNWTQMGTW